MVVRQENHRGNIKMSDKTIHKKNKFGVVKEYVQVSIGTKIIEVPRRYRNPVTDRRHDLTKLSDDGYLKCFLALDYIMKEDMINLRSSPYLTFSKDKWELTQKDGHYILEKQIKESKLDNIVLENTNGENR